MPQAADPDPRSRVRTRCAEARAPDGPSAASGHRGRGVRLLHRRPHHLPPAPSPSFAPEPGQHLPGGRRDRGQLASEFRIEADGGDDLAGHGRAVARLEAGRQGFGEGGVVEDVAGEPAPEAAEHPPHLRSVRLSLPLAPRCRPASRASASSTATQSLSLSRRAARSRGVPQLRWVESGPMRSGSSNAAGRWSSLSTAAKR